MVELADIKAVDHVERRRPLSNRETLQSASDQHQNGLSPEREIGQLNT